MSIEQDHGHRSGSLYGAFAFGTVIVSCFSGYFFFNVRFFASEWMVPVTFAMGAVYAVLGVLGSTYLDCRRGVLAFAYYGALCLLLTAMIALSPIRGFFGI